MVEKKDKILSSDTRKQILVNLKERNKTLSELSREIGVSKPALLKHLFLMSSSDVVKRIKNGNRFIYYKITEEGKRMTDLITSVLVAALGSYIASRFIPYASREEFLVKESGSEGIVEELPAKDTGIPSPPPSSPSEPLSVPSETPSEAPRISEIQSPAPAPSPQGTIPSEHVTTPSPGQWNLQDLLTNIQLEVFAIFIILSVSVFLTLRFVKRKNRLRKI